MKQRNYLKQQPYESRNKLAASQVDFGHAQRNMSEENKELTQIIKKMWERINSSEQNTIDQNVYQKGEQHSVQVGSADLRKPGKHVQGQDDQQGKMDKKEDSAKRSGI